MNRCGHTLLTPELASIARCREPLRFVGIRGAGDTVQRWYQAACGFFTVLNNVGVVVNMTREEPARGFFNHEHATLCRGRGVCVAG